MKTFATFAFVLCSAFVFGQQPVAKKSEKDSLNALFRKRLLLHNKLLTQTPKKQDNMAVYMPQNYNGTLLIHKIDTTFVAKIPVKK